MKSAVPELITLTSLAAIALSASMVHAGGLPPLRISANGRFLVTEGGAPFFWLGDTGWFLFEKLTREDAERYLIDRADKGFTVIQAIAMGIGGIEPNAYGHLALMRDDRGQWDPSRPNEAYFQHVDYIVNKAESLGLYVGLLPVWAASYVRSDRCLFDESDAYAYGKFLGSRYRDKPIVWILGGDWPGEGMENVWRAMARGLDDGDGGTHLASYHPRGGQRSSTWFHNEEWLDINMIQSGHSRKNANYSMIAQDYALEPVKPVVDGEPGYENITEGLRAAGPDVPRLTAADVRRFAYCGVFAGAAGHTYGCNEVYQFWAEGTPPGSRWGATIDWRKAVDLPGARQMQYLRKLIESRPMLDRIPDQSLIVGDAGEWGERVQAIRGSDGGYAFVYTASGKAVTIRLDKMSGKTVKAYWYDPRTGASNAIGEYPSTGMQEFTPPSAGPGDDWVLVLDDASRHFARPGAPMGAGISGRDSGRKGSREEKRP